MSQVCESILQEIGLIVAPFLTDEEKKEYIRVCRKAMAGINDSLACQARMKTFRTMIGRCPVGESRRSWAYLCREKIYGQ